MYAERGIALSGNIRPAHHQLAEYNFDRLFGCNTLSRLEFRESPAGSDPDGAVSLLSEPVKIAVVPGQTVVRIVVAPAGTIPHIHAALRACPQLSRRVEFQKIHQSIAARSLHAFFNCQSFRLQMHSVNAASETIPDPHLPVTTSSQ